MAAATWNFRLGEIFIRTQLGQARFIYLFGN